jgi:OOP family OmpA-OmpF porin
VTSFNKVDDRHQIIGLRDPLAADPDKIIQESGLNSESITSRWELYHSSHPKFIIPRIKRIINPPLSVDIRYDNGVLHTTGSAPDAWIQNARKLMDALPWIETLQFDEMFNLDTELMPPETVQLKLQGTTLMVSGKAPQKWIREIKDKSRFLPGISDIEISKLVNTDLAELEAAVKRVEESALFFKVGSNQLEKGELDKLLVIVEDLKKIIAKAQLFDMKYRIKVIGHADSSGSKENNLNISRDRAEVLISMLQRYGFTPDLFDAIGAGSALAVSDKSSQANKALQRRVNFRIIQIEKSS